MALHATRRAATAGSSDALVCFGASGDLAKKMIFPALYEMAKRGALSIPGTLLAPGTRWHSPTLEKR